MLFLLEREEGKINLFFNTIGWKRDADILGKFFRQSHLGHIGKGQVGQIGKKKKGKSISVTLVKDVQVGHICN